MDEFDTISLESNSCDICKQDTGEELIDCILNDRCLQVRENSVEDTEPYKRAHKDCLGKWKTVVQATLTAKCPSPKRTWKDKLKDLLNRNAEESNVSDAWLEVESASKKRDSTKEIFEEKPNALNFNSNQNNNKTGPKRNSFLTNEEYRIERTEDDIGSCEERARKLRVRSVDKDDEDFEFSHDLLRSEDTMFFRTSWTFAQLDAMCTSDIQDIVVQIKRRIEEASTFLISELQEKDSLRQQADSLHTTVAQLVKLQQKQNIKTLQLDLEQQQSKHQSKISELLQKIKDDLEKMNAPKSLSLPALFSGVCIFN